MCFLQLSFRKMPFHLWNFSNYFFFLSNTTLKKINTITLQNIKVVLGKQKLLLTFLLKYVEKYLKRKNSFKPPIIFSAILRSIQKLGPAVDLTKHVEIICWKCLWTCNTKVYIFYFPFFQRHTCVVLQWYMIF